MSAYHMASAMSIRLMLLFFYTLHLRRIRFFYDAAANTRQCDDARSTDQ